MVYLICWQTPVGCDLIDVSDSLEISSAGSNLSGVCLSVCLMFRQVDLHHSRIGDVCLSVCLSV